MKLCKLIHFSMNFTFSGKGLYIPLMWVMEFLYYKFKINKSLKKKESVSSYFYICVNFPNNGGKCINKLYLGFHPTKD